MASAPFRIAPPRPVAARVALEPVYNALASLAFLHAPEQLADVDPWVSRTAAALTPEQRRRNRLVFEGLGEALTTDRDWPDFPTYLDDLAARDPLALRDWLLARIGRPAPGRAASGDPASPPDPAALLADAPAFVAWIARRYPDDPVDPALQSEVHSLLGDPPALHNLLVSHLRELWETALAAEWDRKGRLLQGLTDWIGRREWPPATAAEAIRAFTGRSLPPAIGAGLDGVREVVFVLSPHVGSYASRFGGDATLWVFIRGRLGEDGTNRRGAVEGLPLRRTPVKPVELVGPLSALADETRLRILELLGRHRELSAQEVIGHLDLSQSSISRHLTQLRATGFLTERRGEGANKRYRLNPARLDWTFLALERLLSGEDADADSPDARAGQPPELRRFLDADGRVATWPAKRKD